MLTFRSKTGELWQDGEFEGLGYSGSGLGRNNPDMESVAGVGPIPRGKYHIGTPFSHEKAGPLTFRLSPEGHDAHGRGGFLIHGDNADHTASHGCIVLGRTIRTKIRDDKEQELEVV